MTSANRLRRRHIVALECIGNIFASLIASIARNPSARDQVFGLGILGFALTEAVALFALLIAFLILFT